MDGDIEITAVCAEGEVESEEGRSSRLTRQEDAIWLRLGGRCAAETFGEMKSGEMLFRKRVERRRRKALDDDTTKGGDKDRQFS